jgi:RNA polymerase sigma-70 factor (ECF subfamily)
MNLREEHSGLDERALVNAAQQGDRDAFKALYDCYRDRVYNYVFYSIGDELRAEDVLQIIFVKIFRGLPGFRFEASLSTWIYRIAVNECLNQQRRRGMRQVPFEALLGSDEEPCAAAADHQHAEAERREIVHRALMELSPKLRSVVALRYLEELSYDEIAAVLECSAGTVASRLNRALGQLEKRLRPLRRLL